MNELESLKQWIFDEREATLGILFHLLGEADEFEMGKYKGMIMAFDEIIVHIRNKLKYGE